MRKYFVVASCAGLYIATLFILFKLFTFIHSTLTLFTLLMPYTIQIALHCLNSSTFAYILFGKVKTLWNELMSKMWEWSGWVDGWYPSDCYDYLSTCNAKKTKGENQTNVVLSFYFWTKLTQYCTVVPRAPDPIHPRHTSAHRQTATNMNAPSNICKPLPWWLHPQKFVNRSQHKCTLEYL